MTTPCPFTTADIITADGGINWCWYTAYTLNPDGTLSVITSDRFHRFNYDQGADSHPTPTHDNSFIIRRQSTHANTPPDWITSAQARLDTACAELGIADSGPIAYVIKLYDHTGDKCFAVRA